MTNSKSSIMSVQHCCKKFICSAFALQLVTVVSQFNKKQLFHCVYTLRISDRRRYIQEVKTLFHHHGLLRYPLNMHLLKQQVHINWISQHVMNQQAKG